MHGFQEFQNVVLGRKNFLWISETRPKRKLLDLWEKGLDELLGDVNNFCTKNDINILNMKDNAQGRVRSRRATKNGHHLQFDISNQ